MSIYSVTIQSDSPLVWYRLGESSGTTAIDSSGNGNSATYTGAYTLGVAGAIAGDNNAAAHLNGGYAQRAPFTFAAGYTVEFWFQMDTLRDYNAGVTQCNGVYGAPFDVYCTATGDLTYVHLTNSARVAITTAGLLANTLYYLAMVWDGANCNLYVNGVPVGSTPAGSALNNGNRVMVGSRDDLATNLVGMIDEAAIYNYALAPARILAHYNAGLTQGFAAPLIVQRCDK